ncbi:MAG: DUF4167 domain-containing protein [Novosphingobium sp.]
MNNNNRGNNRRRGRGNRQNNGGGQQLNRIDSRARGNAPQLLEKYRKLAQDAHLNGDRVQAEYYLQFADHYFRVIADQRLRQEEQRGRPQGERWQDENGDGDDAGEFGGVGDFPNFDQPTFARPQREDRPRREEREPREERAEEEVRSEQPETEESGDANPYEPPENPFLRENRTRTGLRPRRARRDERDDDGDTPAGLDPASLPPAISAGRDEGEAEAEAKPRRRAPRRKSPSGDGGEAVESVN